ncbi:MAG: hypothetical protein PWP23_2089 [Candidatus Sumerlaeota bacterium]|nr:hypothetical protein [Candidatus Sumerlaeota bacterium]
MHIVKPRFDELVRQEFPELAVALDDPLVDWFREHEAPLNTRFLNAGNGVLLFLILLIATGTVVLFFWKGFCLSVSLLFLCLVFWKPLRQAWLRYQQRNVLEGRRPEAVGDVLKAEFQKNLAVDFYLCGVDGRRAAVIFLLESFRRRMPWAYLYYYGIWCFPFLSLLLAGHRIQPSFVIVSIASAVLLKIVFRNDLLYQAFNWSALHVQQAIMQQRSRLGLSELSWKDFSSARLYSEKANIWLGVGFLAMSIGMPCISSFKLKFGSEVYFCINMCLIALVVVANANWGKAYIQSAASIVDLLMTEASSLMECQAIADKNDPDSLNYIKGKYG